MYRLLLLLLFVAFLTACSSVSPQKLGIPASQWDQYDQQQRDKIVQDYQQIQQQKKVHNASLGNSTLTVNIEGGKALLPPFIDMHSYQAISFDIHEGNCHQKINVIDTNDPKSKTVLEACYKNQILYLDPSVYELDKADGSIKLHYIPIWKRGFTYPRVTSDGLVRFKDVNISVREHLNS